MNKKLFENLTWKRAYSYARVSYLQVTVIGEVLNALQVKTANSAVEAVRMSRCQADSKSFCEILRLNSLFKHHAIRHFAQVY